MKRYLLFAFNEYYPGGGWNDFQGSFGTLEEVRAALPKASAEYDDVQIVDVQSLQILSI